MRMRASFGSNTTPWATSASREAAKWQAQTQRAVENFPISGMTVERSLISALAAIKGAAALENARLKTIDARRWQPPLHEVAEEVAEASGTRNFPSMSSRPGRAPRRT
jgi:fumarate hydratase class II